jgi:hypothetical protein
LSDRTVVSLVQGPLCSHAGKNAATQRMSASRSLCRTAHGPIPTFGVYLGAAALSRSFPAQRSILRLGRTAMWPNLGLDRSSECSFPRPAIPSSCSILVGDKTMVRTPWPLAASPSLAVSNALRHNIWLTPKSAVGAVLFRKICQRQDQPRT